MPPRRFIVWLCALAVVWAGGGCKGAPATLPPAAPSAAPPGQPIAAVSAQPSAGPFASRLTYTVDVARGGDATAVVEACREVVAQRLDALVGRGSARVSTKGHELVVELAALSPDDEKLTKEVVTTHGRLALRLLDEAATARVFSQLGNDEALPDEGIAIYSEDAPDGLDAEGRKKTIRSLYARIACSPARYAGESLERCLVRFRSWASRLQSLGELEVGFESTSQFMEDADPPRAVQTGWRTVLLMPRAELTERDIQAVATGERPDESCYLALSLTPAGAVRLGEFSGGHVNRRFAIAVDGVVNSTPIILSKITGGKAIVMMGLGDRSKQQREARGLAAVLGTGALPAPLVLTDEERVVVPPR